MKTQIRQTDPISRTIQPKTKAARQVPIETTLQPQSGDPVFIKQAIYNYKSQSKIGILGHGSQGKINWRGTNRKRILSI